MFVLSALLACTATPADDMELLLDRASEGEIADVQEIAELLIGAGPEAGTQWLAELALRHPEREWIFPEDAPLPIAVDALDRLHEVTADVPGLFAQLWPTLEENQRQDVALVALDLLAHSGEAEDLDHAVLFATPPPPAEGEQPSLTTYRSTGKKFAEVVTALLERSPRTMERVCNYYGRHHEWVSLYLLRGVAGTRSFDALRRLPRLLNIVRRLDEVVLTEIGNVARDIETPLDSGSVLRVRMFLSSSNMTERRQAAIAVGRLDDYEAVPDLIGLLADEESSVRTSAYWALREITAMTIHAEPTRWRLWFDDETGWWAEDSATILAELHSADNAEVCRAIGECAKKRLFRRELTPHLVTMLDHPDATVVRAACSAFFALKATDATPHMVPLLEHPVEEVNFHALAMMQGLTGYSIGLEPEAWTQALAAGRPRAR